MASLLVPPLTALPVAHAWQWAWVRARRRRAARGRGHRHGHPRLARRRATAGPPEPFPLGRFGFGLGGVPVLRPGLHRLHDLHRHAAARAAAGRGFITAFYTLLGVATVASSWLWAGLLQRHRGGVPLAVLNALLAVATLLPVASAHPVAVFVSGALFGSVFCRSWPPPPPSCGTTRRRARGHAASARSPSRSRRGRSWGRAAWAGWPTGRGAAGRAGGVRRRAAAGLRARAGSAAGREHRPREPGVARERVEVGPPPAGRAACSPP